MLISLPNHDTLTAKQPVTPVACHGNGCTQYRDGKVACFEIIFPRYFADACHFNMQANKLVFSGKPTPSFQSYSKLGIRGELELFNIEQYLLS